MLRIASALSYERCASCLTLLCFCHELNGSDGLRGNLYGKVSRSLIGCGTRLKARYFMDLNMHLRALFLLCVSHGVLAGDVAPVMTMHVFEPEQHETLVTESVVPGMNMHVFAEERPQLTERVDTRSMTQTEDSGFDMDFQAGTGYQHDTFSWAVAAPSGSPDTLTQTRWQQNMWGLKGELLLLT